MQQKYIILLFKFILKVRAAPTKIKSKYAFRMHMHNLNIALLLSGYKNCYIYIQYIRGWSMQEEKNGAKTDRCVEKSLLLKFFPSSKNHVFQIKYFIYHTRH